METTSKQQQAAADSANRPAIKSRTSKRIIFAALLLAAIGITLVSWHLMLPESSAFTRPVGPRSVPGSLTEADVREIADVCRRYTLGFA